MFVSFTQNGPVLKSVFIIFFPGEMLKKKVHSICEGFKAAVYDCPDKMSERRNLLCTMKTEIEDINIVCITMFSVITSSILPSGILTVGLYTAF
jgi:vacuolar-type H+-ATPase subunit I/STV1